MKKKIFIALLIFVSILIGFVYYLFNFKFQNTQEVKTDYTVNSNDLIAAFQKDFILSNKKYAEKIIEVRGLISAIELADSSTNLKMTNPNTGSYVIFSFQNDNKDIVMKVKKGEVITVKGSCSGAIYSEILEANVIGFKRCVIIKK